MRSEKAPPGMCPTRPSQAPGLPYLHGFHERERERFRRARDAANTATAPATSSIYEYSAAGRGRPLFLFPQLQLRTGRTGSCCSSSATTSPPPATLLQKQKKLLILNSGRQGLVHQRSAFRSRVFFPSALALAASCRVPFPLAADRPSNKRPPPPPGPGGISRRSHFRTKALGSVCSVPFASARVCLFNKKRY